MMLRQTISVLSIALLGLSVHAPVVNADTIVPNSLASTEGNGNNCYPFTCSGWSPMYQQIYAASNFSENLLIEGLAFRPDGNQGGAFTTTFSNVIIELGTTAIAPDSSGSTSFGIGYVSGVGMTTVYSGALVVSTANTGPAGGPKDFDLKINFMTPYLYDTSAGNLLFQFRSLGTMTVTASSFTQMDASYLTNDGMSRRWAGNSDTGGLVTQFDAATAVPESSSLHYFAAGLLLIAAAATRKLRVSWQARAGRTL